MSSPIARQIQLKYDTNRELEQQFARKIREQNAAFERGLNRITAKMYAFEQKLKQLHARLMASPGLERVWEATEVKKDEKDRTVESTEDRAARKRKRTAFVAWDEVEEENRRNMENLNKMTMELERLHTQLSKPREEKEDAAK